MDAGRWQLIRIGENSSCDDNHVLDADNVYSIGRYRDNKIILKSLVVSRRHGRIQNEAGSLSLIDNQSENGTFINEIRISNPKVPHVLNAGDVVGFGAPTHEGDTTYVFRVERYSSRSVTTSYGESSVDIGALQKPSIQSGSLEVPPSVEAFAETRIANAVTAAPPLQFAPIEMKVETSYNEPASSAVYVPMPNPQETAVNTPIQGSKALVLNAQVRETRASNVPTTVIRDQNVRLPALRSSRNSATVDELSVIKVFDSPEKSSPVQGSRLEKRKLEQESGDSSAKKLRQTAADANINRHGVRVSLGHDVGVQPISNADGSSNSHNFNMRQENSKAFSSNCIFQKHSSEIECIEISDDDDEVMNVESVNDANVNQQNVLTKLISETIPSSTSIKLSQIEDTCQPNVLVGSSGKELPLPTSTKEERNNWSDEEMAIEHKPFDREKRLSPKLNPEVGGELGGQLKISNPAGIFLKSEPNDVELIDCDGEEKNLNDSFMDSINKMANETDSKAGVLEKFSQYSMQEIEYIVITDDEDDDIFPASQLFNDSHSVSKPNQEPDGSDSEDGTPQHAEDFAVDMDGNEYPSEFARTVKEEEEDEDDDDSSDGWYMKLSQSKSTKDIPLRVSKIEEILARPDEITEISSDTESDEDVIPNKGIAKKSRPQVIASDSSSDTSPAPSRIPPPPTMILWQRDSDDTDDDAAPFAAVNPPASFKEKEVDSDSSVVTASVLEPAPDEESETDSDWEAPVAAPKRGQKDPQKISDIERLRVERLRKARPLMIDAFPMPPRRGHLRGISFSEADRLTKKMQGVTSKVAAENKELAERGRMLMEEQRKKKQEEENAARLAEEECVDHGIPVRVAKQRISSVKSRHPKKRVKDDAESNPSKEKKEKKDKNKSKSKADKAENIKLLRNERLKEIAAKAKAEKLKQASDASHAKKVAKKPTIKVTENNRGAFLVAPIAGSIAANVKVAKLLPKISDLPRIPKLPTVIPLTSEHSQMPSKSIDSTETRKLAPLASEIGEIKRRNSVPSEPSALNVISQRSETSCTRVSTLPETSKVLSKVDINRDCPPSSAQYENTVTSSKCLSATSVHRSSSGSLKSCLRPPLQKGIKKKISWNNKELCKVRICERYISQMTPHPVGNAKDIPPPNDYRAHGVQATCPNLYETISDICTWNTQWLKEQVASDEPPPVNYKNPQFQMLTQFSSYADYCKVIRPLMMLELWASIWKDSKENVDRAPLLIGLDRVRRSKNFITNNKRLDVLECHGLLTAEDSRQNRYPRVGDLVLFHLMLQKDEETGQPKRVKPGESNEAPLNALRVKRVTFAYVTEVRKVPFTDKAIGHIGLFAKIENAKFLVHLKLLTKKRECVICFHPVTLLEVVSCVRPKLRPFEAIGYLERSPLCNFILNPIKEDYSLPDVDISKFLPYDISEKGRLNSTQKLAVLKTAKACLIDEPKICLIQGPPGTGKSLVIVNLVSHILKSNDGQSPKILFCAPSNAAVDEIIIRLLGVQKNMEKHRQFKMVRVGRMETMDPSVKQVSLDNLITQSLMQPRDIESLDSVALEINTLRAKCTKVELELDYAKRNNRDISTLTNKLANYQQMIKNITMGRGIEKSSYEKHLERIDAERRILDDADIIAVTLSSSVTHVMENLSHGLSQFKCCIVDEASQCSEPECLLPLMQGVKTLVLVGDPKQLPATTHSQVAKKLGFGQSLLSRLSNCFTDEDVNPIQMLTQQYRMHPEILQWPNSTFYANQLVTPNEVNRASPLRPYRILSHDFQQSGRELSNHKEAELVVSLVQCVLKLLAARRMDLNIGVITPYSKQRNKIKDMLQQCGLGETVAVNTIDGYQGKERDVIIMSCVRTRGTGFMSDAQRLNVSLTRARFSMIICANFQSLEGDPLWRSLKEDSFVRTASVRLLPQHLHNGKALEAELLRL